MTVIGALLTMGLLGELVRRFGRREFAHMGRGYGAVGEVVGFGLGAALGLGLVLLAAWSAWVAVAVTALVLIGGWLFERRY